MPVDAKEAPSSASQDVTPALPGEGNGQGQPAGPAGPAAGARTGRRLALLVVLLAALFGGLFLVGLLPRLRQNEALATESARVRGAVPVVQVAVAEHRPTTVTLVLPGNVKPWEETPIWAQTTGYLQRWHVDYGVQVQEGQLLAEIAAPEVDDQLTQARAARKLAEAERDRAEESRQLADIEYKRAERIGPPAVSEEDVQKARAAARVARATLEAARASVEVAGANVRRLEDLQKFQKVYAPFNGFITDRFVDTGALIVANDRARPLFHIARRDKLRVLAAVPQAYAPLLQPGQSAEVTAREFPGRVWKGQVSRDRGVLDPAQRTLTVEVEVPNEDLVLRPGSYIQVKFELKRPQPPVEIPASALISDAEGNRVALVGADDRLHYRTVSVGRDFGATVEVLAGLAAGDVVVVNVGDNLPEGSAVRRADSLPR
jgi:RND family efflux transporter MFP subunit